MADLQRAAISSDQAPPPLGAYSVGMTVNAGRLLYVAGQVGVNVEGNLVVRNLCNDELIGTVLLP